MNTQNCIDMVRFSIIFVCDFEKILFFLQKRPLLQLLLNKLHDIILLQPKTSVGGVKFCSAEHATESLRPYIVVETMHFISNVPMVYKIKNVGQGGYYINVDNGLDYNNTNIIIPYKTEKRLIK